MPDVGLQSPRTSEVDGDVFEHQVRGAFGVLPVQEGMDSSGDPQLSIQEAPKPEVQDNSFTIWDGGPHPK